MSLTATPVPLGPYGVWLRHDIATPELATAVERLGYGTLWLGGSPGADLKAAGDVLAATRRLSVATGIVNIWSAGAEPVADSWHRLEAEHPGRFLLGIGAGHRELNGPGAEKPYGAVSRYLDVLDAREVPADRRVLAALGPRMLKLSAERAAGSHPYLVHPEFSRTARAELGPEALLAPEQKVALGTDRAETRAVGRGPYRSGAVPRPADDQLPRQLPPDGLRRPGLRGRRQRPAHRRGGGPGHAGGGRGGSPRPHRRRCRPRGRAAARP